MIKTNHQKELTNNKSQYSLKAIFTNNKVKIAITLLMVILELVSGLLIPLFMGYAINDLIKGVYDGLIGLSVLVAVSVVIGSLRRFYDSRIYGKIYIQVARQLVKEERIKGSTTSTITARVGLLNELVEFFENSFPEIMNGAIGIIGVILILWSIDYRVCLMCFAIVFIIVLVYGLTSKLNLKYNTDFNNELETLVDRLDSEDEKEIETYLQNIIKINIKLSDLETFNFSTVLTFAMGVFIVSMMMSVAGNVNYGQVFALLMYVFEFIERLIVLPLYYQNYLRLKEISQRLSGR